MNDTQEQTDINKQILDLKALSKRYQEAQRRKTGMLLCSNPLLKMLDNANLFEPVNYNSNTKGESK